MIRLFVRPLHGTGRDEACAERQTTILESRLTAWVGWDNPPFFVIPIFYGMNKVFEVDKIRDVDGSGM